MGVAHKKFDDKWQRYDQTGRAAVSLAPAAEIAPPPFGGDGHASLSSRCRCADADVIEHDLKPVNRVIMDTALDTAIMWSTFCLQALVQSSCG